MASTIAWALSDARVSQRTVRTIARQSLRYGRANAAASAGHECNSAFQVRHR
jgi:hypothetical protein